MSFCDFAENVEDCSGFFDTDEKNQAGKAPDLLWLSDIPLFESLASTMKNKPRGHSYLTDAEEHNASELQCTYRTSRVTYRDESYIYGGGGESVTGATDSLSSSTTSKVGGAASDKRDDYDDDDDEWFASTAFVENVEKDADGNIIPKLEVTPDWYEKYSSVLCRTDDPKKILAVLKKMFSCDDRIVFTIPETHYQIRGSVYLVTEEKPMQFLVNIFKDVNPDEYLVEFQRQSGCMLDFQALYRQTLSHLNEIDGFLVVKIRASSSGIFNFVDTADPTAASASKSPHTSPVALETFRDAMENCEKRFVSKLAEVRNEALCTLVVASKEVAYIGDEDSKRVVGVLSSASTNLSSSSAAGLSTETGRCVATVLNNLCLAKVGLDEEESKVRETFLARVVEKVVPVLLSYWVSDRTAKCLPQRKETDKQITQLLCLLKNYLGAGHVSVMEKKLVLIDEHIAEENATSYKTMRDYLAGVIAAVKEGQGV